LGNRFLSYRKATDSEVRLKYQLSYEINIHKAGISVSCFGLSIQCITNIQKESAFVITHDTDAQQ
jgi:hypothetical protein